MKLFVAVSLLSLLWGAKAQYAPYHSPLVDDTPYAMFSTHFTCAAIDPLLGYAIVRFGGGHQAYPGNTPSARSIVFSDGTATSSISTAFEYARAYKQAGTDWVYLRDLTTGSIVDYLQIEIVTHGVYSGDCMTRMTTGENGLTGEDGGPYPPDGWDSGSLPPAFTPSNN